MTPGEAEFLAAVRRNPMVTTVLDRLIDLELPDGHLAPPRGPALARQRRTGARLRRPGPSIGRQNG